MLKVWPFYVRPWPRRLDQNDLLVLRDRYMEGDTEAGDRIVYGYADLVRSVAKSIPSQTVTFEDRCQEGCDGLLKAAVKFDTKRGASFPTHARWWIRASITRAVTNTDGMIRIPAGRREKINRIRKQIREYEQTYGCRPTTTELCEALHISVQDADIALSSIFSMTSLEAVVDELDSPRGRRLEQFLADDQPGNDDVLVLEASARRARIALQQLPERARFVIEARMGFLGDPQTLQLIGDQLGVSRERVRQIEAEALNHLRDKM